LVKINKSIHLQSSYIKKIFTDTYGILHGRVFTRLIHKLKHCPGELICHHIPATPGHSFFLPGLLQAY